MTYRENLTELLAHLSNELQCAPITLDDNGMAMMSLDEFGVVFYAEEGETETTGYLITNVVVDKPDASDAELLYDLLCANYMWNASGEGSLAIDAQSGVLVVHRMMTLPMSVTDFEDALAMLIGAARYWKARTTPEHDPNIQLETGSMRV